MAHEAVPRRGLAGYVPSIAAEWAEVRGSERWQVVDGTLCLIDISGSAALFERLAAHGRVAAEELTDLLSDVFSRMIDRVQERGGTQLKFGGDALQVAGGSPASRRRWGSCPLPSNAAFGSRRWSSSSISSSSSRSPN